jgi:hypothetical protein
MTRYFDSYEDEDQEPRSVECNRCGKGGLHWEDVWEGKTQTFHLYDAKMKKHVCPPIDVSDDFDVVT